MVAVKTDDRGADAMAGMANDLWWLLLVQGVVAVFFGIVSIFWPGLTLTALVYLFSAFVLAWGIVEIIHGFLGIGRGHSWWLTLVFGIAGLGAGIYLVRHPHVSFTALILIIGLLLIGRGILDIVGIFLERHSAANKALSAIIGVAAVGAGIIILFQPVSGGVAFVWILGLYAFIYGALTIALGIQAREALLPPDELHKRM